MRRFFYELRTTLTRDYTWETVFRVRFSRGFKIRMTYGNYSVKSNDLLNLVCSTEYPNFMKR